VINKRRSEKLCNRMPDQSYTDKNTLTNASGLLQYNIIVLEFTLWLRQI